MIENKEIDVNKDPFEDSHTTSFKLIKDVDEKSFNEEEKVLLKIFVKNFWIGQQTRLWSRRT